MHERGHDSGIIDAHSTVCRQLMPDEQAADYLCTAPELPALRLAVTLLMDHPNVPEVSAMVGCCLRYRENAIRQVEKILAEAHAIRVTKKQIAEACGIAFSLLSDRRRQISPQIAPAVVFHAQRLMSAKKAQLATESQPQADQA